MSLQMLIEPCFPGSNFQCLIVFYFFPVAPGFFFIVRYVRPLGILLFIFTAVQFITVGRTGTVSYHLLILHIVL